MNSHSSQARAADCSERNYSDGDTLDTSKTTATAKRSSRPVYETAFLTLPQSLETSETSYPVAQPAAIEALRTWLQLASLVSRSPSQDDDKGQAMNETCGPPQSQSFAQYDRDSASWKTSQAYLDLGMPEPSLAIWPKAGSMWSGVVFRREIAAHQSKGSDFLLPAPTRSMARRGWGLSKTGDNRYSAERTQNALSFGYKPPLSLLEWSMGWPITWSNVKPLAMDKYQSWLQQHGEL